MACQQGEFQVSIEKPSYQNEECTRLRLLYPKKIGFFDNVQVKIFSKLSADYIVSAYLRTYDNGEQYSSFFCLTEEAVKASSVTIKYTSDGGKIGAAVFCNEEIVIDDLAGLLAQGGKVYGRSDVQSK